MRPRAQKPKNAQTKTWGFFFAFSKNLFYFKVRKIRDFLDFLLIQTQAPFQVAFFLALFLEIDQKAPINLCAALS